MEKEFEKELIVQLANFGYAKLKGMRAIFNREKIKDKIKELEPIETFKEICDFADTKKNLLYVIIAHCIATNADEFLDLMNNPEKMLSLEALELYVLLNLFYNIDMPECDGKYYRYKLLDNLDSLIKKYEQVNLAYLN